MAMCAAGLGAPWQRPQRSTYNLAMGEPASGRGCTGGGVSCGPHATTPATASIAAPLNIFRFIFLRVVLGGVLVRGIFRVGVRATFDFGPVISDHVKHKGAEYE